MITRFAPSPTGYLHLGHAFSALTAYRAALHAGGIFLLRLEDIDHTRCRQAYADAILEDLGWLGIKIPQPVWVQSKRMKTYAAALTQLQARGLMYRCYCTRRDIAAHLSAPHEANEARYPGTCRHANHPHRNAAYAWRLDSAKALELYPTLYWQEGIVVHTVTPDDIDDVIIARKEMPASYHLCVVLDDAAQGITDIYRGIDLQKCTPIHRLLQAVFNFSSPVYHHHKLIAGTDRKKFSKRDNSVTLRDLRAAGESRDDVLRLMAINT
jgi:glutamyl-Q tRNA(Asp) synthetase